MSLFFFAIKYIILITSITGYGFFFQNYFIKHNKIENKSVSIGHVGLYGVFFLILISYCTNFFFAHNYVHNLIIIFCGIYFFLYFSFRFNNFINKLDKIIFTFFIFLSIFALILFKNHDDFLYYHLNFINNLTLGKTEFGLGNFDPAFNHISSLFFLNSLLKLPFTEDYFYNTSTVFIMVCVNTIIIKNTFIKFRYKDLDFFLFLNLCCFLFINIFFYRLSEHGTDRSAQIIILLLFIILFEIFSSKNIPYKKIENFLIFLSLTITIKTFYLIYSFLFLFIFFKFYQIRKIDKFFNDYRKALYCCLAASFFIVLYNIVYTGCFIFPLKISCFDNLFWGQGTERVSSLLNWYQIWSKGGAGPNFRVENPLYYISGFNWVQNWFKIYFFNHISDTIFALIFMVIVLLIIFQPKLLLFKFDKNFIPIFIFLIFIFAEWFYIHPALRYGGFHIVALFFFIPLSIFLSNQNFNYKNILFKFCFLLCLGICIFVLRNIIRINKEIRQYSFSILKPYYVTDYSLQKRKDKVFFDTKICSVEQKLSKEDRVNLGSPNCKIIKGYVFYY